MDDNIFDRRIKDKVENYKDTGVDEKALADLHKKMSGTSPGRSYMSYKNWVGYAMAILLTSLINFGLFSYLHLHNEGVKAAIEELKISRMSYDQLKSDFEALKTSKTDTVYIFKKQSASSTINQSNTTYLKPQAMLSEAGDDAIPLHINLGKAEEISPEIRSFLGQYGLAYLDQNGNVYLRYNNMDEISFAKRKGFENIIAVNDPAISIKPQDKTEPHVSAKEKTPLSVKMLRAMEKQKLTGIGFQFGPELDVFKLNTDIGRGRPGTSAGVVAEFILSPALRIEAGAKYSLSAYKISTAKELGTDQISSYPAIEKQIGTLQSISVTNHAVMIPLRLKYIYPLAHERHIFASLGIAPQYMLTRFMDYTYGYDIDTGGEDDFGVAIEASKKIDDAYFNMGVLNAGIGVERILKNKSILQLSAFYSHSLAPMGSEGREFYIFGLRSALKFRFK